ncbi:Cytochrome P450 52A13 [Talaromyces atroroseus]|uniref:Cytochrome P450 52A13 n=1 Tax=Talaromyces atroroseus TaxID=1441469 RepID=A0A1Q5Q9V7_TALAT|nr:Cytochrome P450 52A13 [Talaromyces atroroseus]OKL62608.1 Cytochrome P450 52A13 [Talaromyces atroroseus]
MLAIIIGALALFFLLLRPLYNYFRHRANARRLNCRPPHTKHYKWPFGIDGIRRLEQADKRDMVCDEFFTIYKEEGAATFQHWLFGQRQIMTAEPRNVQAILATQFSDFEIPVIRQNSFWPMLGQGIFTANGQIWSHSRAILRPQFTRQQVSDLELEEKHVQQLLMHIKPDPATGWAQPTNLGPLFFRLTIDSATEFLFGQSVESQLQALPGAMSETNPAHNWRNLAHHFDDGTNHLAKRARFSDLYWLHNPAEFRKDCEEVHRFADHFVQQALERTIAEEKAEAAGAEKKRYVFLHELIKETKDPIELRCQLLHILLAGRDTTAGLLGWTFFLLSRHPAIYQKLRETILETFGPYDSPRDITFERLKACTYLQHVLQETLRLYPSVPLNSRMATKDTTLPTGGGPDGTSPIYVAKGEQVGYAVYVMQRRKDIWGPDADQFVPERWATRKAGWEYLPFNGGPRICLGQQFALTEAGYVTTRLVQLFDNITAVYPDEVDKHQYSVTSAPKAVLVNLHTAQAA